MSIEANCPGCGTKVQVPESLLGKRVKCPKCSQIFMAEEPNAAGFEEVPEDDPKRPSRPAQTRPDDEGADDDDYGERRPRRRWRQPHRGTMILVFGILSLVICAPLGIAAWIMGNNDLAAMRRGEMDRSGEGSTQAGKICGMIGTIFMIAGCVIYGVIFAFAMAAGAGGAHGRRF